MLMRDFKAHTYTHRVQGSVVEQSELEQSGEMASPLVGTTGPMNSFCVRRGPAQSLARIGGAA